MTEKQLVVVVEGTAALAPYWHTILTDYIEKIIRSFCGNESNGQKLSGAIPEFALVVFNTHGPYSAFLVQRSGWTMDADTFFRWLSAIPFGGGGFSEAAIAEGLAEALMMFPVTPNGTQNHQNPDAQRHCILVAGSNPHSLPTPVYCPPISGPEHNEKGEVHAEMCLADAETVAKLFSLLFVSLSVMSPKQLPKLRAIYNAGERNTCAADPTSDYLKNSQFLALLSDSFLEARAALSHPSVGSISGNQNIARLDGTPAPVQGPVTTSIPPVNVSMGNHQPFGNITTTTVKLEPTTMPAVVSGSVYTSISNVVSQGTPNLQTCSPSPTSQEMNANSETMQEHQPIVNPQQSTRPVGPANVSILNNLSSQHRQVMSSASITGASSIELQTIGGTSMAVHVPNMMSSGMASSAMTGIAGSGTLAAPTQLAQSTALGSSIVLVNSNIGISSAMMNLQAKIGVGQSVAGLGQGIPPSGGQLGQGGIGMNQNMPSNIRPTGMASGSRAMIPTPGISQQTGVNSTGLKNNSAMPMVSNASGIQQNQTKYIKLWEGALSGQRQGQPIFICRLEGYRSVTASETLAADWPPAMQIVRLISQDHMNNKQYHGKADILVFRTLNQHGFLGQLQEKKLCVVIQLRSQTLLLSMTEKAGRLLGMLFPGDMVVFKPQIGNQQLQQQQLQQSQQQQLQQIRQHQSFGQGSGGR